MARPEWSTVFRYLADGTWTLEEAARQMAMSTQGLLAQLTTAARMRGPAQALARQALARVSAGAGMAGGATAATGLRALAQAAAARIGVSVTTFVLGSTVVAVLVLGGIYLATRPSAPEPIPPILTGPPAVTFGVFLVDNDVMVGVEEDIRNRALCDTLTWGTDCDARLGDVATISLALGPFATIEEAASAYCQSLDPATISRDPLSDATFAVAVDGQEHEIQNAPPC